MNKPKPFDALLCDLGNVIAFFDHNISAQNLGRIINVPADEVYEKVFHSEYTEAFVLGHIDANEFYSRMKMLFPGTSFPCYEEFVNIWIMIFRPNHAMIEALEELYGQVKLVMVSNTNELHFDWIQNKFPQIVAPFRGNLILSHQVHLQKPQPEMFEKAMEMAGVPADRCLFVDDIEEYTEVAKKLGMKAVHYTDHRRFLHAAFPGEYLP